jgi:2-iminobutanoate/2-iminopropanoate deaminase
MQLSKLTLGGLLVLCAGALTGTAYAQTAPAAPNNIPGRTAVYPAGVIPIAPYSPGILQNNILFISGQIPQVAGAIPASAGDGVDDIKEQTTIVLDNLSKVLAEAGLGWANVASVTVYIVDLALFADFNSVYGQIWTTAGVTPPTRATVQVAALPGGNANARTLIEISAIAVR